MGASMRLLIAALSLSLLCVACVSQPIPAAKAATNPFSQLDRSLIASVAISPVVTGSGWIERSGNGLVIVHSSEPGGSLIPQPFCILDAESGAALVSILSGATVSSIAREPRLGDVAVEVRLGGATLEGRIVLEEGSRLPMKPAIAFQEIQYQIDDDQLDALTRLVETPRRC